MRLVVVALLVGWLPMETSFGQIAGGDGDSPARRSSFFDASYWSARAAADTGSGVDGMSDSESAGDGHVSYGRLAIVGGGMIATMAGIHIYQQNGWWKDNRAPFHFQEDLNYGLWVDKVGHFYGATVFTFIARKAFEWTGLSERTSMWLGSGGALLFQTYIEIEDGFSKWGFDRVDFAANFLGAAWPVGRYYLPFMRNVDVKFSYHPSQLLHSQGGIGFRGQQHLIFDDYEGQTLWLSIKVHNVLPKSAQDYWPPWLALAVGYGARDIASPRSYPVVFLALDYDMSRIIPQDTWFLKTLGEALNFIHFPAPAVRISPSAIWYGFYF
jgi:hypothetical protein